MLKRPMRTMLITVAAVLAATTAPFAADLNDVIGALPKFAIPTEMGPTTSASHASPTNTASEAGTAAIWISRG